MDYIAQLSCEAHVEVMQRVKPGMKEYQMRAIFEGLSLIFSLCQKPL